MEDSVAMPEKKATEAEEARLTSAPQGYAGQTWIPVSPPLLPRRSMGAETRTLTYLKILFFN